MTSRDPSSLPRTIPARMARALFPGGGAIVLEEAPVPQPEPGELLLRVDACALCGSDRSLLETGSNATPGHETAGIVVARGAGTHVAEGTLGAVFLVVFCGRCERCRAGSRGACLEKEAMLGFTRDGGFAQFEIVPERCFLPLDRRLGPDDAVMLLDMTGTPMHALRRAGLVASPPDRAAVVGAGPVGLACVMALRALGVARVLALDVVPYRLDFAARLGAEPILANDGARERIAASGGGLPAVVEASGNPQGQRLALDVVGPGGLLIVIGHSPAPLEVSSSRDLIAQEKTILGSEYFDPGEFEPNQELVVSGRHSPSRLITHRFPLAAIEDAYRLFWSGGTGKVLIYPNGVPDMATSELHAATPLPRLGPS
jgi:threonine 3-dehydrogenase